MPTLNHTQEQLERCLAAVCKVIGQIPSYYFAHQHVLRRFDPHKPWDMDLAAMTHNAALESTMINVRALNEFFKPGGRPRDVRSHHYGVTSIAPFLDVSIEEDINKFLAHITLAIAEIGGRPFDIALMMLGGLTTGGEFLKSIEQSFPFQDAAMKEQVATLHAATARAAQQISEQFVIPPQQGQPPSPA